ncbi:hypothetical protein QCA50_020983 [Cerrena zonata]|uniref:Uncharacterized protein n=1 Tax=Cerrena zonata TaxID=2478898 RepID=A0AAW0FDD5_9APHY
MSSPLELIGNSTYSNWAKMTARPRTARSGPISFVERYLRLETHGGGPWASETGKQTKNGRSRRGIFRQ